MSSCGDVSAQTVGSSETERQYPILMSYKHSHGIPGVSTVGSSETRTRESMTSHYYKLSHGIPGVSTVGSSEAIRQENPHL